MLKRLLLFSVALVLVAYIGAEMLAGAYAEERMAGYIEEREPLITDPQVSLSKPLVLDLLTDSTIRRATIASDRVPLGPVTADRVEAVLNGIRVDRGASLSQQKVVVSSIDSIEVSVAIRQEEVSKVLPRGFNFIFDAGGVTVAGPGFRVKGMISATGPGSLRFKTSGSLPVTVKVPPLKFLRLPLVGCIPQVQTSPGVLKLTCTETNPSFPRHIPS
ncbi:MAG: LmeA family phospholipid-binding protein [Actinomycetota bacterium]